MKNRKTQFAVAFLFLAACSAPEILMPRDGTVPSGVDLSGSWQIQPASARNQRRIRDAIRKTDGVDDDAAFPRDHAQPGQHSARTSRRVRGGLVYVFLELGESLKITQTAHGLFISFDRSVVEEYRFGGSQVVSVGQVEAQRAVGWEGKALVVDTLDRNRMKLTDRYQLIDNGRVLERTIIFRSRALAEETVIQRYDRAPE